MFAVASLALTAGVAAGWTPLSFKVYYLFGAILNVPWLALGTVELLASRAVAGPISPAWPPSPWSAWSWSRWPG